MSYNTESRWFKIATFIISGFFIGFSIANLVYYDRLRKGNCDTISTGEATSMLWLNVILLIIAVLMFFWALWKLIFSQEKRKSIATATRNYFASTDPLYRNTSSLEGQVPGSSVATVTSRSAAADIVPANEEMKITGLQNELT